MDEAMRRRIGFARWRSDLASGGNRYDDELAAALPSLGWDLREYALTGPWPFPEKHDEEQLASVLSAERDWLIGNIVGSAAPAAINAVVQAGGRVWMLVHFFPTDDPTLSHSMREQIRTSEAEAVNAASGIIVPSAWAAREIASRYGREDAVVAPPGVVPARLAPGSKRTGAPPQILWLARLSPTKDPVTFVNALLQLRDLEWTAQLVGPDSADENLRHDVTARLAESGMTDRILVLGSREGDALDVIWMRTDLLVHTSRTETYGMVVSEALGRGIPSVVPSGTGAVEAQQGAGETFPVGDTDALATILREWLSKPELQDRWRGAAEDRRAHHLPTWERTAQIVSAELGRTGMFGN